MIGMFQTFKTIFLLYMKLQTYFTDNLNIDWWFYVIGEMKCNYKAITIAILRRIWSYMSPTLIISDNNTSDNSPAVSQLPRLFLPTFVINLLIVQPFKWSVSTSKTKKLWPLWRDLLFCHYVCPSTRGMEGFWLVRSFDNGYHMQHWLACFSNPHKQNNKCTKIY